MIDDKSLTNVLFKQDIYLTKLKDLLVATMPGVPVGILNYHDYADKPREPIDDMKELIKEAKLPVNRKERRKLKSRRKGDWDGS